MKIHDLKHEYTFHVGSTVNIKCSASGIPSPFVWWTKGSEDEFYSNGDTLIKENVQVNYNILVHHYVLCNPRW